MLYTLCFGVPDGWFPLPGADHDARLMAQALAPWVNQQHILCGSDVTVASLQAALTHLSCLACPGDTLLIYGSTHGAPSFGEPKFLATHDGRWHGPEIAAGLEAFVGCDVHLWWDACCSGGLLGLPHQRVHCAPHTSPHAPLFDNTTAQADRPWPHTPARVQAICAATDDGFAPQLTLQQGEPPVGVLGAALRTMLGEGVGHSLSEAGIALAAQLPRGSRMVVQSSHPDGLDAPWSPLLPRSV